MLWMFRTAFIPLVDYVKTKEYLHKALKLVTPGEGSRYQNVRILLRSLVDYVKAKEYLALAIEIEIGGKNCERSCYVNLGIASIPLAKLLGANSVNGVKKQFRLQSR